MSIKITTPNSGSDALTFGSATTATVAEVTGTEVSSGEGKLELKTTTGSTSATKVTVLANGNVGIGSSNPAQKLHVANAGRLGLQVEATTTDIAELLLKNSTEAWGVKNEGGNFVIADESTGVFFTIIKDTGDLKFNSGYGSAATAYGCRAWVNFNGTSTVAIRASGNVSSITDNSTGNYTVNFAAAMPDVNYAVMGLASSTMTGRAASVSPHFSGTYSTSATQFLVKDSADITIDSVTVSIAILR